ncbi:MAG: c-type cytochrome [Planctomycetes bacterium]|nr:c-type cytochrome [Planctomycetota bacterium]
MEIISLVLVLLGSPTPEKSFEIITVPQGFTKQIVATEPLVMDPVSFCFDDQGHILVAESFRQESGVPDNRSSSFWLLDDLASQTIEDRLAMFEKWADQRENGMDFYTDKQERIRLLTDKNKDGVFDRVTDFASGFNEPLDGTGAGVLAIDGTVWYTNIPNLWRLEDFDGDGKADRREKIFTGFGVRVALRGHDLHGLEIGLDGRLYWSIGDRGYHIELEDGKVFHSPGEGGVFRCELDGSILEVFHHGLRNPQELAFDKYGNLFTGDNNSDDVDKARLVYCVEGGETGWRMEYQTLQGENARGPWVQEHGWDPFAENRPAWILPAVDTIGSGPSGLVAYPGAGFPARYADHFFMCDFRGGASHSNVLSFAVEQKGAGFKMVDLHPFVEKVLCTDVGFGYDGRMVVSDWGEGWTGNKEGRLYAVWNEAHVNEGDVSDIFSGGFHHYSTTQLLTFLSHVDRRVRIRAQLALVDEGASEPLITGLQSANQLARIHAMWGLAMIDRSGEPQMQHIAPLLDDADQEIVAQACHILGESTYIQTFPKLTSLITSDSPRVQYFATIAASHLGNPKKEVLQMLEENDNADVYLRHAGVVALAESQTPEVLCELSSHRSQAVRLAAVLALRKQASPLVVVFLQDENLGVATAAARAIHDVPIDAGMEHLAASISVAKGTPWQRRAISASKRLSMGAKKVALFAADSSHDKLLRKIAVHALQSWNEPFPRREIVEGRIVHEVNKPETGDLDKEILLIVANTQGELLADALSLAQSHRVVLPEELTRTLLEDESQPISLRVYCVQVLDDDHAIAYGLQSDVWQVRAASRDLLLAQDQERGVSLLLEAVVGGEMGEAQAAITSLAKDTDGFANIEKEAVPVELQLEFAHASGEPLMFGDPRKGWWLHRGGNAQAGKKVVYNNPRSQCIRCHKIKEHGGIAGPALDGVADRLSERELLEALLVPNQNVTEGYGEYSAMPPMGVLLDHRELRDVMAYLKTLKAEK